MLGKRATTRWFRVLAIGAVIFGVGLGLGYEVSRWTIGKTIPAAFNWRDTTSDYAFISPLLACKSPDKSLLSAYKDLKAKLDNVVSQEIQTGRVSAVAVYFRDLQTGQWTGVNEDAQFYPASLLKLPVALALYKEAETDAALLSRRIVYRQTAAENSNEFNSSTSTHLEAGSSYTVDQLIEAMIVDSDNNAKDLLEGATDVEVLTSLFDTLDIPVPYEGLADADYGISPRQYSLLLRVLYNATFLNAAMSEKVLGLLSHAVFADGLAAGLPANTRVAHKFGIYGNPTIGKGVHDCGIVYYTDKPYSVCVMTKGVNYADLETAISKVSSTIYSYVNAK
ncbi:MAG: serine hydrolase [bacterium]